MYVYSCKYIDRRIAYVCMYTYSNGFSRLAKGIPKLFDLLKSLKHSGCRSVAPLKPLTCN